MIKEIKPILLLVAVCVASAIGLTFTYRTTQPKIAQHKEDEKTSSMRKVLRKASDFKEVVPGKQWVGYKNGVKVGKVIVTSIQGYGGPIGIMVAADAGKKISGIKILYHTETPGLGAKITASKFLDQFRGRCSSEVDLKKDEPETGRIDAVTAATISSRAVTRAIYDAMKAIE